MPRLLAILLLLAIVAPGHAAAEDPARPAPSSRGGRSAPVGVLVPVAVHTPAPEIQPTPTNVPTPAAADPVAEPSPVEQDPVQRWRALVAAYPDWDPDLALAVIACESRGDPGAVNPRSGAAGLFQLLGWQRLADLLAGVGANLFDPSVNVAAAHWLWAHGGGFWWHWAASRACWAPGA
jgi:soluble lytic murein transglycosylase-like protein